MLVVCLTGAGISGYAQEGNIWAFGVVAGIDFNTSPPTPVRTGINTSEGCAAICNDNGQLLFYTDGTSVWNRTNNVMPNGGNLPGITANGTPVNITVSTSQGTVIVPVPGDDRKYYIFSLGNWESRLYFGNLYYSIVDMTLDNGLGDVLTKGVLLDTALTEHMTVASGNDCDVWLIVVSRRDNRFKAYNIDVSGIHPNPVISQGIPAKQLETFSEVSGTIDVAPDLTRLAITQHKVVLYNFNAASGAITHPVVLDTAVAGVKASFFGLAFSPGNTRLYASLAEPSAGETAAMYQYDLSSGDSMTIVNSKTVISPSQIYAIKRAPDGKIYTTGRHGAPALHVINKPDLPGTACQFVANGFALYPGTVSIIGLPNLGTLFTHKKVYSTTTDSSLCSGPRTLTARDLSGRNYMWKGNVPGPTRIADTAGVYWVSYQIPVNTPCKYEVHVDTFKVGFRYTTSNIHTTARDSGMCRADTVLIAAGNPYGTNYTWDNGSTGRQRSIYQPGTYWVRYDIDSLCEHHTDTFIITWPAQSYRVSFIADTLACQGEPVAFQNTSDPVFTDFSWSFGDQGTSALQDPQHAYGNAGSYRAMLIGHMNNSCPPDTAYQTIIVDAAVINTFSAYPDSICAGAPVTFLPQINDHTVNSLYWQFGDGTAVVSANKKVTTHSYNASGAMPVTLTTHFRACPDTAFTDTLHIYANPVVDMGPDTAICPNSSPVELSNLYVDTTGYDYSWNTGARTASIFISNPGTYYLTAHANGCAATDTIEVRKSCFIDVPNAFTPNGDGINDYFFPGNIFSDAVAGFNMQIYNRWGQKLFETNNIHGSGWDGRHHNNPQPEGVYIYVIEAVFANGKEEKQQGNVTLIR